MIPEIDFQTHDILTRIFIPPFRDKKKFAKNAKNFIKHFKKIEKEVLKSIEKHSGFKWTKKKIPVYLIPANNSSYSFASVDLEQGFPGVVQKLYESKITSASILIHELCHVNQLHSDFNEKKNSFIFNKKGEREDLKVEICTDVVCIHVLREVFGKNSEEEKDKWHFLNKLQTSIPGKQLKIPKYLKKWDLNKKTLREYIIK